MFKIYEWTDPPRILVGDLRLGLVDLGINRSKDSCPDVAPVAYSLFWLPQARSEVDQCNRGAGPRIRLTWNLLMYTRS